MSQIEISKINRRIDDVVSKLTALTDRLDKMDAERAADKDNHAAARTEDEAKVRESINASVAAAFDALKPEIKSLVKAATRNLSA